MISDSMICMLNVSLTIKRRKECFTTYGNLLSGAGGDMINIGKNSEKSPSLSKKLQYISSVELLLGEKTSMNKLTTEGKKWPLDMFLLLSALPGIVSPVLPCVQ